jgi:hypothetical protein
MRISLPFLASIVELLLQRFYSSEEKISKLPSVWRIVTRVSPRTSEGITDLKLTLTSIGWTPIVEIRSHKKMMKVFKLHHEEKSIAQTNSDDIGKTPMFPQVLLP